MCLTASLRKFGFADLVSVGPSKEPKANNPGPEKKAEADKKQPDKNPEADKKRPRRSLLNKRLPRKRLPKLATELYSYHSSKEL